MARRQLLALGFTRSAIEHRLRTGRLSTVWPAVYVVGRRELSREGRWMGAILACGESAFLTHLSAGALYGICDERPGRIEVGVRVAHPVGPADLRVRRRPSLPGSDLGTVARIPITSPARTMTDLATELGPKGLARAVNEADKREVIDVEALRTELNARTGQPGVKVLRTLCASPTTRSSTSPATSSASSTQPPPA